MKTLVDLKNAGERDLYGGKASNLAQLLQSDSPVPPGFAIGVKAFDVSGKLISSEKKEAESILGLGKLYAVRSSALAEDAEEASWAGQFETFLNVKATEVIAKVEECHNSIKTRAQAYADKQTGPKKFDVAVVIQEMIAPKFAGVLFTKDPSDGSNNMIVEYVDGLGEKLVHGDADPERAVWSRSKKVVLEQSAKKMPFDIAELIILSEKIEKLFGVPQDIEWAFDGEKIWIVQSRAITTLKPRGEGKHYLGDPHKLFYWGPSRGNPLYMGDFLEAAKQFFAKLHAEQHLPNPPKTIVLFHEGKMVWLNKSKAFGGFVSSLFQAYEKLNKVEQDMADWQEATGQLDAEAGKALPANKLLDLLVACWRATLFAEFSLYGAEAVLTDRLKRFDEKSRHEIWGAMTMPDKPLFMQTIDMELAAGQDPLAMAKKYPWIDDGYFGVNDDASQHFTKRLKIVGTNSETTTGSAQKRENVIDQYKLTPKEVAAFELARKLAEFMDDRKAWMMRSRRYISAAAKNIAADKKLKVSELSQFSLGQLAKASPPSPFFGWSYKSGKSYFLNHFETGMAWDWYVEFKAAKSVLSGIVASSGGRHFINGEVFVVDSPTDPVPDDKIIVVPSTSPSYVPMMRTARALVTDHGGMMSHAAIVAREFGLPCISGTIKATKLLKTGDKVVLNLVTGEVNR